jgi:hypothetical protein
LELAHRKLDVAVLDAYGWPHDLSDEEILERLLALNLERAGGIAFIHDRPAGAGDAVVEHIGGGDMRPDCG